MTLTRLFARLRRSGSLDRRGERVYQFLSPEHCRTAIALGNDPETSSLINRRRDHLEAINTIRPSVSLSVEKGTEEVMEYINKEGGAIRVPFPPSHYPDHERLSRGKVVYEIGLHRRERRWHARDGLSLTLYGRSTTKRLLFGCVNADPCKRRFFTQPISCHISKTLL